MTHCCVDVPRRLHWCVQTSPPFSVPALLGLETSSGDTREQQHCPEIWVSDMAVLSFLQPSWHYSKPSIKHSTDLLKSLEQYSEMMREGPLKIHEKSRKKCPFLMCSFSPVQEAKCLLLIVVSRWLQKGCFWQLYVSLVFLSSLLSSPCQEARGAAAALTFHQ